MTDRILRELNIIELMFTAQYMKYDKADPDPFILDHTGKSGIDGRYIAALDVYSNVELLNLQLYKKHFTQRFESSANHKLLKNQLTEIRQKAEQVKSYFNANLTGKSDIVKEYVETQKDLDKNKQFEESIELFEKHSAIVTIYDYSVMELYLGVQRTTRRKEKYTYTYISDNYTLALFCQRLLDFIDSIGTVNKGIKLKNKPESLLQIWTKGESHYNKVIEFLKEVSATVGCSFINDKLRWQKFDNSITYLAAFTFTCINKGHIENIHSAPDYQSIYKSTFSIVFNPKPFQSISTKVFPQSILDAFINMP